MAYTIENVFSLLFPDAGAKAAALDVPDTDQDFRWKESDYTLWFPDPTVTENAAVYASVDEARRLLSAHVASKAITWEAEDPWWARGEKPDDEVFIADTARRYTAASPERLNPIRHIPPRLPYDVFLIAAHLIEAAGVYHHIQAEKTDLASGAKPADERRHIAITKEDRDVVAAAAAAWRNIPAELFQEGREVELANYLISGKGGLVWTALAPLFQSWLVVFGAYARADVFIQLSARPGSARPAPRWWFHIWRLLAIADEAAAGTGYTINVDELMAAGTLKTDIPWFEMERLYAFAQSAEGQLLPGIEAKGGKKAARADDRGGIEIPEFETLSNGRREIGCVLPKVRTPAIGCTLRSLTHHLALLPGVGVARGRWKPCVYRPSVQTGPMPHGQMNMLLVPFPYSVDAKAFKGSIVQQADMEGGTTAYGYFDVEQQWLERSGGPEKIIAFLKDLIDAARSQAAAINAVVFPELSLDFKTYTAVKDFLTGNLPEIELLVAGLSSKSDGRAGNFVAVTPFHQPMGEAGTRKIDGETIREKHHRWKLDKSQLASYGLLGVLSPEVSWWENIELLSRRVDFAVLRKKSVVAALICEDLARVDPCQLLLRSVAPNLVISLLMDASQANGRWPARYATVLAEDPGCAVLTLTSRALMTRQHRLGVYPSKGEDRYVAMWRQDGDSAPRSIHCPYDAQGVLLTIQEGKAVDVSLDGRRDGDAMAWRYAGHIPVRIPSAQQKYADLLGRDDLACW